MDIIACRGLLLVQPDILIQCEEPDVQKVECLPQVTWQVSRSAKRKKLHFEGVEGRDNPNLLLQTIPLALSFNQPPAHFTGQENL